MFFFLFQLHVVYAFRMLDRPRRIIFPLLSIALAALAACSSPPHAANSAPEDFAVGVTILADASGTSTAPPAAWQRSAWYLVEPDAQLRAAEGERLAASLTPPVLRQLTAEEMDELWLAASKLQVNQGPAAESGANDAPRPGDQPGTAIIYLRSQGNRSATRVDLRAQTPQADATRDLATLLARWAGMQR